ncbi:MAG: hypothetical protein J0M02_04485 [Planctomycetes bacterium]|nr:hypothetical protein [Planctomycetota bacterium]
MHMPWGSGENGIQPVEMARNGFAHLTVDGTAILGCWRSGGRIPERIARGLRACARRITADRAAAPDS